MRLCGLIEINTTTFMKVRDLTGYLEEFMSWTVLIVDFNLVPVEAFIVYRSIGVITKLSSLEPDTVV